MCVCVLQNHNYQGRTVSVFWLLFLFAANKDLVFTFHRSFLDLLFTYYFKWSGLTLLHAPGGS